MHELLLDIRQRLLSKEYQNEEHVRLSLVARVVQELGWNIWNPTEVYTEFKATKKEYHTRVDVALFTPGFEATAVFIGDCSHLRFLFHSRHVWPSGSQNAIEFTGDDESGKSWQERHHKNVGGRERLRQALLRCVG